MNKSAARMENIPSTMVLHKNVDGAETIFSIMAGPLVNNNLDKCLRVIRIGKCLSSAEDIRWVYKPVSDLWTEKEPDNDSSVDVSSDEGI